MAFLRFKKKLRAPADTGRAQKAKRTIKRSPPVAMEVKLLAMEALEAGGRTPHARCVPRSYTVL